MLKNRSDFSATWFNSGDAIIRKTKTQAVLRIPTGFAPVYDLPGHLWETRGAICHTTRLMCVFKIVAVFCCFWYIIIIHTYYWTWNRSTIGFLKNIVVWPSTARRVSNTSMVVRASNQWNSSVPFEEGLNLKRLLTDFCTLLK